MDQLLQDLRLSVRLLAKHRGFATVAAVTLAFGIGANTAVFSVVNAVLLRPLPYAEAEGLLRVSEQRQIPGGGSMSILTNETYHAWLEGTRTVAELAAYTPREFTLTGAGEPRRVRGAATSAALFPLLGVGPVTGRAFTAEEEREGANRLALLGHSLWQNAFGGDDRIVGRSILLDEQPYAVVGVMPPAFAFPDPASEIWIPFFVPQPSQNPNQRMMLAFSALARLKAGVTPAEAQAEGDTVVKALASGRPRLPMDAGQPPGLTLVPLQEELVREVRPALLVLAAAVVLVLLIGTANLANLLLARGATRCREMAVRAAIGAGRGRLVRQLLTESLVLAALGGLAGLLLAVALVRLVPALVPSDLPRIDQVSIDGRVLAFALLVTITTGLVVGLVPSLQGMRVDLVRGLSEGGSAASGGFRFARGNRTRLTLVVGEVAVALVLLVGAGLLLKSFVRLVNVDMGFDPANVITAQLNLPSARYTAAVANQFYDDLLERVAGPRVEAAAITGSLPLTQGQMVVAFRILNRPDAADEGPTSASVRITTPNYLRAMGIRLTEGRPLLSSDTETSQSVLLVNDTFARRYFPGQSLVGRHLPVFGTESEIVGIVADVRHGGFDSQTQPEIYLTPRQARQFRGGGAVLVVRAKGDPLAIVPELREVVRSLDPNLAVDNFMTMDERVAASVARPRFYALLTGVFAALALLLAGIGLYGVVAYGVAQRTREIGVRMALGAGDRRIFSLILGQGALLAGLGVAIGLAGAAVASRSLTALLFGVAPGDASIYAAVTVPVALVTLAACYVPARRATRIRPLDALRSER